MVTDTSEAVRINAKPGLLVGARHVVLPEGITGTMGARDEAAAGKLGLSFEGWQSDLTRSISARRGDKWAARTVVMSIPRQVGKTFLIGALAFARCRETPGLTVVWTAHRFKVARESFQFMRSLAAIPGSGVASEDDVATAAGNETIRFANGSRIVFAARERGAIRGFSDVGLLVLDEAQILSDAALGDLMPTMNRASDPQMILMGTPPRPNDPGEAFTRLRDAALSGRSRGLLFVQFSAPDDADPDARKAWAEANPSYPHHTPDVALQGLRDALHEDDFRREVLGIWDEVGANWVIPKAPWAAAADLATERDESLPIVYGLDVSPTRGSAAVAVAYWLKDGSRRIEVAAHKFGADWVGPWLSSPDRAEEPLVTVLDAGGPAGSLVPELVRAGVRPLLKGGAAEMKAACGALYDGVVSGQVRHVGDPLLTEALQAAEKRVLLDAWAWSRKDSAGDITPLVAATLAAYGLMKRRPRKAHGGLVVLGR